MTISINNDVLRNKIDSIIQSIQSPTAQSIAFEDIRKVTPHSIYLAKLEDFYNLQGDITNEYDCFTFALDLIDCEERIAVREYSPRTIGPAKLFGIANVLPGPNFLQFLPIPTQPSLESCNGNGLVVYYNKFGDAQHISKIIDNIIISKWGHKGGLWQHGLWEIPSSYGIPKKFYSSIPKELIRERWLDYLSELEMRVNGFSNLVSVMLENKDKNLNHKDLLKISRKNLQTKGI